MIVCKHDGTNGEYTKTGMTRMAMQFCMTVDANDMMSRAWEMADGAYYTIGYYVYVLLL